MPGAFLEPHNFSDPENTEHGQFVHMQLKNDLYFSALEQISHVEFGFFDPAGKEEWVKVEKMN